MGMSKNDGKPGRVSSPPLLLAASDANLARNSERLLRCVCCSAGHRGRELASLGVLEVLIFPHRLFAFYAIILSRGILIINRYDE